jgi:hypothetical protein
MKIVHKVEECAVYESNKHSYAHALSQHSSSSLDAPIKTFLLKISSSGSPESASASTLLSYIAAKSLKQAYSYTSTSVKFKALQVVPLKSFIEHVHSDTEMLGMAYTLILKMLADIGTQLEQIRLEHGLVIPFLSLEDIIVIETREQQDDKQQEKQEIDKMAFYFVYINAEKLIQQKQQQNKELVVDVPLKVNKNTSFLPPELPESALKRLPMRLTTTSWYYSLSTLCIYALLQHKFKNGEDDIERIGRPFLHTSLYFCLKRCLKQDPEERVLLYV